MALSGGKGERPTQAGAGRARGLDLSQAQAFHATATMLFELFRRVGREFDHDYASCAVLSAFLVASATDTLREAAGRGQAVAYRPAVLSATRIAEMTGLPRETVRRKCASLQARKLLRRLDNGRYRCVVDPRIARDLVHRFRVELGVRPDSSHSTF